MKFENRIKKIEDRLPTEEDSDEFPGWTDEDLRKYIATGIKPAGKEIHIRESTRKKYANWTKEELLHYATTGEKPKRFI